MRGLDWRPLQLPLAAGVNQKADDRALPAPELAAAIDVQFDELGGLQTRKPFSAIGSTIAGSGTIATARRIEANGNELVLFTKDSVYSWNDQLNRWVFRATHLAVAVEERTAFATPGDQYDADRAELSGIVYYAWCDNDVVYVAAQDKASGAVINAPTAVTGTGTRPRLLALATRVLLFWHAGTDGVPGDQKVVSIDPTVTDPATLAGRLAGTGWLTILSAANCGAYYDVTRILGDAQAIWVGRRSTTTSYEVAKIPEAAAFATNSTKARTCDGPIAVSSDPTGATVQVVRANGTDIQGDRLTTSSLADAATAQAVGTTAALATASQIAVAHRSVQDGGAYRCYAFWSYNESSGSTNWQAKSNWVDTGGSLGTEGLFGYRFGIGSRAFDHEGRVFLWTVFAGESGFGGAGVEAFRAQLQNTYFLWRDDATLHGKAAAARGGGYSTIARLPGVAGTTGAGFAWCAVERRIIPIGSGGKQLSYAKRAPHDVTFEFDANGARRCVRLGETLYVTGSELLQYDGVGLFEVGFHVYPWYFVGAAGGAGNVPDGTYTYKITWRWENARGERDRSTTATTGDVVISTGPDKVTMDITALNTTRKTTTRPVSVEVWRTAVNPTEGAPFYLTTAQDPTDTSNPNRYLPNTPSSSLTATYEDDFTDAVLTTKETDPENGDVLEHLAPLGASLIAASADRVFLGGVSGDPDRIWYSRLRQDGEVVSFHDTLTIDVPKDGGDITALAIQQGILVVYRERATYMFPGDGYDNTGRGVNYGPPQVVSYDIGCRDTDSVAVTPEGIAFHSGKGKYLLTRGWTMKPIGLQVSDYDSETVVAAHVVSAQHQVRFVTASRMLVWDYLANQWAEWTTTSGVHAVVWQGGYHYLVAAGPLAEQATYSATTYGLDVETAWIKPGDLQGAVGIRKLQLLGEYRGAAYVRVRVAYDYKPAWVDEEYIAVPASLATGDPLQLPISTSRVKLQAIKIRVSPVGGATRATMVTTTDVPLLRSGEITTTTWSATFGAVPPGSLGNDITLSIGVSVIAGSATEIEVRDHQHFEAATSTWTTRADNVGIRVTVATTDTVVLISAVEAAINAYSQLLDVTVAHVGAAWLNVNLLDDLTVLIEETAGGAFGPTSGESLKLTGLGMEVGLTPRLYKRFPRT